MIGPDEAESPGTMVVVSDRIAAVVSIRDWQMKSAGHGLIPFVRRFSPGLYRVSISYPGVPVSDSVVTVPSGSMTFLRFALVASNGERRWHAHSRNVALRDQDLVSTFAETIFPPSSRTLPAQSVKEGVTGHSGDVTPSYLRDNAASISCWQLNGDGAATPLESFEHHVIYEAEATCVCIRLPQCSGAIVQLAIRGGSINNVSIPGGCLPHNDVVLHLTRGPGGLCASVELECWWMRVIEGYRRESRLEEARQLIAGQLQSIRDLAELIDGLQGVIGPATRSYLPYALLRLYPEDSVWDLVESPSSEDPTVGMLCQNSSDWAVVVAEANARIGNHSKSLKLLERVESLGLPVYTEGYWMLVSSLRYYLEPGQEELELGDSVAETASTADRLLNSALRWAPHIDPSTLTLSYPGADVCRFGGRSPRANSGTAPRGRYVELRQDAEIWAATHSVPRPQPGPDAGRAAMAGIRGFEGGEPLDSLTALRAVRSLVAHLGFQADARVQLRRFLGLLSQYERQFEADEWKRLVLRTADREAWPQWAVQSLDFPARLSSGAMIVWSPLAELLKSFGLKEEASMCSDEVYLFNNLPRRASREVSRARYLLDEARTAYPYLSARGCTAHAVVLLKENIAPQLLTRYRRIPRRTDAILQTFKREQYQKLRLPSPA